MSFQDIIDAISKVGLPLALSGLLIWVLVLGVNLIYRWLQIKLAQLKTGSAGLEPKKRPNARDRISNTFNRDDMHKDAGESSSGLHATIPSSERHKLLNHYVFLTAHDLLHFEIGKIACGCPIRTQMFQDIGAAFIDTWKNAIKDFIVHSYHGETRRNEDVLAKKLGYHTVQWQRNFIDRCEEMGVPMEVLQMYNEWSGPRVEEMLKSMRRAVTYDHFEGKTLDNRMVVLLSMMDLRMKLSIIDLHWLMWKLNGRLDGLEYAGGRVTPWIHMSEQPSGGYERTPSSAMNTVISGSSTRRPTTGTNAVTGEAGGERPALPKPPEAPPSDTYERIASEVVELRAVVRDEPTIRAQSQFNPHESGGHQIPLEQTDPAEVKTDREEIQMPPERPHRSPSRSIEHDSDTNIQAHIRRLVDEDEADDAAS